MRTDQPERAAAPRAEMEIRPSILGLLSAERLEDDLFRFCTVFDDPHRLFGGQVAAQALLAAGLTVPDDRVPHSLHGYFLRAGSALRPTVFQVERDRDGRSFSARRVVALQNGEVIFNMAASFAAIRTDEEPVIDTEPHRPPLPRDPLPSWVYLRHPSFECRSDSADAWPDRLWLRCTADLPDDPLLHAAILTYTSDMSSGLFALRARTGHGGEGASLDHAVWFHRPVRMDDWVLQDLVPHTVAAGRGLYTGAVYEAGGGRVATIAQEALFRPHRGSASRS